VSGDFRAGRERSKGAMEFVWFAAFVLAWFALQLWVLPKFGVPT
jgi:hypothetical protein